MGKEIGYRVQYRLSVLAKDLPRLDTYWQREISTAIGQKLEKSPELYGIPLRQTLQGLRKLRVGNYRVIYKIEKRTVHVLIIGHRSQVYKEVLKRLGL